MIKMMTVPNLPAKRWFTNVTNFILLLWPNILVPFAGVKVCQTVIQISVKRMIIRIDAILINQLRDEIRGKCNYKRIYKNGESRQGIKNWIPGAYILRHIGHGTTLVADEIDSVNSNF